MEKYDFFNTNTYGTHVKATKIIGKNKKVLDVGCATGKMSKILSENECEVIGIEIDPKSAEIAKKYCKEVLIENLELLENLPYPKRYFDVILFADILEHLKSPLVALKMLKKYLKDDGMIIISIPNVTYWIIRLSFLLGKFEYKEYGILDKTHLRFFTKNSSENLLQDAGFKIISFDTIPQGFLTSNIGSKIEHLFTKIRPNIFAYQFLIVGKKD